jgi:hypothetical protein
MHSRNAILPLLLGLGMLLGAGRGPDHAAAPESQPTTTKGAVTIQLPKGWTLNANGGGRAVLAALAPQADADASGKFQASLSISQDAGNAINADAQQKNLAKQMPGYAAVEQPTPVAVGGMQGVYFGGTFKSGNVVLRTRQYMFTVNNQVYTITFTSLNSVWANYKPALEAAVATFTVKK